MNSWLRRLPPLGIGIALIALVQTVLAVIGAAAWLRIVFAVVLFLAAVGAELVKQRDRRRQAAAAAAERDANADAERAARQRLVTALVRRWPPLRADEEDPFLLGVQRPVGPGSDAAGQYVRRDVDHAVITKLQSDGTLLLIGEPASGVTRTALHAMTEKWPHALVLAPDPDRLEAPRQLLEELNVLAELGCPSKTVVLWLDRIERWLSGGLSAGWLHELRNGARLRVVATISTGAYRRSEPLHPELFAEFGAPVRIRRLPSPRELADAQQAYPGIDFAEGIAAAFTAAASLLRRWRAGFGDCPVEPPDADCPVARAVVETCVDWQRTGTPRPVPRAELSTLSQQRLAQPEPIIPDHLDAVLEWATTRTREAASLLLSDPTEGETASVRTDSRFAELLAEEAEAVPDEVWTVAHDEALQAGDAEAAGRIGFQAHVVRNWDIAAAVWNQVTSLESADAEWLDRAAEFSENRGDPAGQVLARDRLLELTELAYGPDTVQTADALTNLGNALAELGEPDKARSHHERALRICQDRLGREDLKVAASLNHIGTAWRDLGSPDKARTHHERALRIYHKQLGLDHLFVADCLTSLGNAWRELGVADKALDHHGRALRIYQDQFGSDHPAVATSLINLGAVWFDLGDHNQARDHFERALRIRQDRLGPAHIRVADCFNNVGAAWSLLGHPDLARDYYQQALRIFQDRLGPDHPAVADSLTNLGNSWSALGHPNQARDHFERALRIREDRLRPDHPDIATSFNNLGNTLADLGELDKARDCFERALHIYKAQLGPDHPNVATSLSNLANAWSELGSPDKARELLQQALTIYRAHFPATHPDVRRVERTLRIVDPDTIRVHGHEASMPAPDPTD